MRIAVLGKGGSGKTTISASIIKYFSENKKRVLAIDADVNEHLSALLKIPKPKETIGHNFDFLFNYIFEKRKNYKEIPKLGCIPPSFDSRFIFLHERDNLIKKFTTNKKNIFLALTGKYKAEDVGVTCFHGQLYPTELFLHYLIEGKEDLVVIDSNAGIDTVSTSLYMASDIYIFAVEPTLKSINVFLEYEKITKEINKKLFVIGNKIKTKEDEKFIKKYINQSKIIGFIQNSQKLKKVEQGQDSFFDLFIQENQKILKKIEHTLNQNKKNSETYLKQLKQHFVNVTNGRLKERYKIKTEDYLNNDFTYEKLANLTEDEYFDTCYLNSISNYRKKSLIFLAKNIKGEVLEIGAGKMPWFWALSYIKNIKSVIFTEYSKDLLNKYEEFIQNLDIKNLEEIHSETMLFLKRNKIIDKNTSLKILIENIIKKSKTLQYNFLEKPKFNKKFDSIFGMEAIELVNTEKEFEVVFKNIFDLLKNDGIFVGTTFPYEYIDKKVNELIRLNLEGQYNPGKKQIKKIATKIGFSKIEIKEMKHQNTKGPYKTALFIRSIK